MPLDVKESTSEEVGYLIEELHISGCWPILVYNVSKNTNRNMYSEINKHCAYIILISGPCEEWTEYISHFQQQLYKLSAGNNTWHSWNPRAKFIVSVMSNCKQKENRKISRAIHIELWLNEVMKATFLFLILNEQGCNDLHGSVTDSVYGTYLEMHTFDPYENAQKCNVNEDTLAVKLYTVQKFCDIKGSCIFQKYHNKNFHKCQIRVHALTAPPFLNPPKLVSNNESRYQELCESGWEIELLGVVGYALNMSLDIEIRNQRDNFKSSPDIYVGGLCALPSMKFNIMKVTHNYFTNTISWYTPCAVQNQRWSRFFKIFSVDMWVCFVLLIAWAVITVCFISNYKHTLHLQESTSYNNIFSATANVIAVVLSVSVNTQPRSAPLRLFFFFWVCYSVAIRTVFQAYFTTYLIEPGYEEPIRTVEEMLTKKMILKEDMK